MAERDSRPGYVDHVERYVATDDEDGHDFHGRPALLLTTRGRRSGELHTLPLIYARDGDRYLVTASNGGRPAQPSWYLNVLADAEVDVQVKGDRFHARARVATAAERPRLWTIVTGVFPGYAEYQSKLDRQIPVVVLEPAATP
jgi:deazaflavin-dependent oxidoreductase (nitroreductase family)